MKLIEGKYATAKVFTDNIEEAASQQILTLCNQSFVDGCKSALCPMFMLALVALLVLLLI